MIVEFFASLILTLVTAILTVLLPTADPLGIVVPSGLVHGYSILNSFLPVDVLVTVLGLMLTVYAAQFLVNIALLVLNLLRGSGARASA